MKKVCVLSMILAAVFVGCPIGGGGGGDDENAKIAELMDYCPQKCLKYQECNLDVFNLKWNSLEACEKECDLRTEANDCSAECDVQHAGNEVERVACVNYCRREVDPDACKVQCEGISDEYSYNGCVSGCTRQFSQTCADVHAGINNCYLNLECERAIEYRDFGGSASDLGECTNDTGEGNAC